MGSQAIQIFWEFRIPVSHNHFCRFINDNYANYKTRRWRIFSGGRSGGSRWDWDGNSNPNRRSRFTDSYATDERDEEDGFGFRKAARQRVWWSDDVDAEDDEEDDNGFGILETAIGFDWVSKIFQAFGWMIPAVVVSMLMGMGPDAVIMTLALPLAQSAFALAADTLWGRADETPRPKSKRKKRPLAGSAARTRARKEKEIQTRMRKEASNYRSWFEGNKSAMDSSSRQDFGGWDELDNPVRPDKDPCASPVKNEEEPRAEKTFKTSRRTKGDTPLLMRLLIAMFPFLEFWTKLF